MSAGSIIYRLANIKYLVISLKFLLLGFILSFLGCANSISDENASKNNIKTKSKLLSNDCLESFPLKINKSIGDGCGDIFLFQEFKVGVLTIEINPNKIELDTNCRSFQIQDGIKINLEVYYTKLTPKDSIRRVDYCNCKQYPNVQKRLKIPIKEADIKVLKRNNPLNKNTYFVSCLVSGVKVFDPISKVFIKLEAIKFQNVLVGWKAG